MLYHLGKSKDNKLKRKIETGVFQSTISLYLLKQCSMSNLFSFNLDTVTNHLHFCMIAITVLKAFYIQVMRKFFK